MSRASELTRQSLIDEAVAAFAAKGFEGASVRAITQKAKANQAAINYHFGSKDGLYREVLRVAVAAFSERALLTVDTVDTVDREEAVRLFVRQQLEPLMRNSKAGRYLRIFAWESIAPSQVFQEYLASEQIPALVLAERIVRRFAPPDAAREDIMVKTLWLGSQASTFVRYSATLSRPPIGLTVDQPFVERLIATVSALAIAALRDGAGEGTRDKTLEATGA
jgi:AcrR family transcriptional regulator